MLKVETEFIPLQKNAKPESDFVGSLNFNLKREFIHFGQNEIDELDISVTPQLLSP